MIIIALSLASAQALLNNLIFYFVLSVNRAGGGPSSRSFWPPKPLAEPLEMPSGVGLPQIFSNFTVELS